MKNYRNFRDYHLEKLANQECAQIYLEVALEEYEQDKDAEAFLLALKDVAEAQGGVGKLAQKTKLSRQSLYKILSTKGNPRLETIGAILTALGFRLSIVSLPSTRQNLKISKNRTKKSSSMTKSLKKVYK